MQLSSCRFPFSNDTLTLLPHTIVRADAPCLRTRAFSLCTRCMRLSPSLSPSAKTESPTILPSGSTCYSSCCPCSRTLKLPPCTPCTPPPFPSLASKLSQDRITYNSSFVYNLPVVRGQCHARGRTHSLRALLHVRNRFPL